MIHINKYFYYYTTAVFFFIGAVFFLIYKDVLVVKFFLDKKYKETSLSLGSQVVGRKEVKLFYFKDDKFHFDTKKLVLFKDKIELLKHLVNNWLAFLQEERIITKRVCLDTVCLDKSEQQVFFSFDRLFLEQDWSIYYKWNFIESLFKTIRESGLQINSVVFLVNHKQMCDDHLDFSVPWPIGGFY